MDLATLEKYLAPKHICGIYFLFKEGNLQYVGKSVNIAQRIGTHTITKDFDSYAYIEVPEKQLDLKEKELISLFRPPLNIVTPEAKPTKCLLTDEYIESLPFSTDEWHYDTEVPGFAIRLQRRRKTFVVRFRNSKRQSKKYHCGLFPITTVEQARRLAIETINRLGHKPYSGRKIRNKPDGRNEP
jgi:hypothetical protein